MRSPGSYAAAELAPTGAADPGRGVVADLLDEEMRRRLLEPVEIGSDTLARLIRRLVARLGAAEDRAAQAEHELHLRGLRERFEQREQALGRIQDAIATLREITSPSAMLEAAPEALCGASELDRVLLSTVDDGTMTAAEAFFRADAEGALAAVAALRAEPIRLEHPLVETEVLRRRRATVVTDAQLHPRVHPALTRVMRWDSYVAAPVSVRSRVIAVVHADRGPGQSLDVLHRDVLWEFATGLAQAYESAGLRRTLRHEREQMRRFLERLNARLGALSDAAVELVPRARSEPARVLGRPRDETVERPSLDTLLTRRELEVLELVASGLTNRAIADRLVISQGTVKFHVHGILRKLRVSNRAEAVSRYLHAQARRGRD